MPETPPTNLEATNEVLSQMGSDVRELKGIVETMLSDQEKALAEHGRVSAESGLRETLLAKGASRAAAYAGEFAKDERFSPTFEVIKDINGGVSNGDYKKSFDWLLQAAPEKDDPNGELLDTFHKCSDRLALNLALQGAKRVRQMGNQMGSQPMEDEPAVAMERKRFQSVKARVEKAYSIPDNAQWWPTEWSTDLVQKIYMLPTFFKQVRQYQIPMHPFVLPVQPQAPQAFVGNAQNYDTGTLPGFVNEGSQNVTFTAKSIAAASVVSEQFELGATIDIVSEITRQLAEGLAEAIDMAFLNGDTAAANASLAGIDGAAVTGLNDVRVLQNGLRKYCITNSYVVSGASPVLGTLQNTRLKMLPRYRANYDRSAWFTSDAVRGYMMAATNFSQIQTVYAIGQALATMPNATLGWLFGSPLFVGPAFSEQMNSTGQDGRLFGNPATQDSTGTLSGTYNTSALMILHRDTWGFGMAGGPRVGVEWDMVRGQYKVVARQYIDYAPLFGASAASIALADNWPTTV